MRCAVTMVSNVSDRSDAWRGVLLHAHMSEQKCHMEWATRRFKPGRVDLHTHARMPTDVNISVQACVSVRPCTRNI